MVEKQRHRDRESDIDSFDGQASKMKLVLEDLNWARMKIRSIGMFIWLGKMAWQHIAIKLKVVEYFWSMETLLHR